MTSLSLVVDTGGSQTKIIFQTPQMDSPEYMLMPPEVEQISQKQFDRYKERIGWLGSPSAQQQAWFTVGEQLWVVGAFAGEFDPEDRLLEKKYENALYKVLAAVGVIAQKLQISRRQLSVHLALLLPWQEFNDRKAFEEQLHLLLDEFAFRGKKLTVRLKKFLCRPEGAGLAVARTRVKGLDWFQQRRIMVLLFGHRNTSAIYFEYGQFKRGDSPLYGFSQLIDFILERHSILDKQALLIALVKAMQEKKNRAKSRIELSHYRFETAPEPYHLTSYPTWSECDSIQALVSVRAEALRAAETQTLDQAISQATEVYWEKLLAWIEQVMPDTVDEVVVSGGAAFFLSPKLEDYFDADRREQPFEGNLVWDAELAEQMKEVFRWFSSDQQLLVSRFADAYGLFNLMILSAKEKAA